MQEAAKIDYMKTQNIFQTHNSKSASESPYRKCFIQTRASIDMQTVIITLKNTEGNTFDFRNVQQTNRKKKFRHQSIVVIAHCPSCCVRVNKESMQPFMQRILYLEHILKSIRTWRTNSTLHDYHSKCRKQSWILSSVFYLSKMLITLTSINIYVLCRLSGKWHHILMCF